MWKMKLLCQTTQKYKTIQAYSIFLHDKVYIQIRPCPLEESIGRKIPSHRPNQFHRTYLTCSQATSDRFVSTLCQPNPDKNFSKRLRKRRLPQAFPSSILFLMTQKSKHNMGAIYSETPTMLACAITGAEGPFSSIRFSLA